jgi:Protein of unknown function (DUF663).
MGAITLFSLQEGKLKDIQIAENSFNQNFDNYPKFSYETEYEILEEYPKEIRAPVFVLLALETPLLVHEGQTIIGSKLDTDIEANVCRIAFYGKMILGIDGEGNEALKDIKIFKRKEKKGVIDRVQDSSTLIIKDLFSKQSDISKFVGTKVEIPVAGCTGTIKGTFGQSGKIKVQSDKLLFGETDKEEAEKKLVGSEIVMKLKKYLFKK